MSFSNTETAIVASHLVSDTNLYHTVSILITDLLSSNEVSDATILLSNNLRTIIHGELSSIFTGFNASSLIYRLINYSFARIRFNEIADEFIADRIAVG